MSFFDEYYSSVAEPWLSEINADKQAVTYVSADGKTTVTDLDAIIRNDRWETELTSAGERRLRLRDCSIRTADMPPVEAKGHVIIQATGERWGIRTVTERSPTLTWMEIYNRKAHEDTRPEMRVPRL